MIINPILKGFHPDPSICRVGDDYYIANSTFQWFPGVRLHHSRDLVNWEFTGYALTEKTHLDLLGVEDNAGIWAPCLSHCDGVFYLIFTIVKNWTSAYKDAHNYITTSTSIHGPWLKPVHLNSSGFDPSLFHDDDGKKWFLNVLWNHRVSKNPFSGILIQKYNPNSKKLEGPMTNIFKGTHLGLVEGPHLYKKDNFYYLLTAEGGTSWNHAVTLARSENILGPYEVMPQNPLCTSKDDTLLTLQRAGHGSLVETQNEKWYLTHLCGRPVMPQRKCILGRETAIQALLWPSGQWPRLAHGTNTPSLTTQTPFDENTKFQQQNTKIVDNFDSETLHPEFNSLRIPMTPDWIDTGSRPGYLRMCGQESLYSKHNQSLIAQRITSFYTEAGCSIDFFPHALSQMAGLIFYYDTTNYHYLCITWENGNRIITIITCDAGKQIEYPGTVILLPQKGTVFLKGILKEDTLYFYMGLEDCNYQQVGPPLDSTIISDENKVEVKFTGAFAGICVQDMTGHKLHADFDWFSKESLE